MRQDRDEFKRQSGHGRDDPPLPKTDGPASPVWCEHGSPAWKVEYETEEKKGGFDHGVGHSLLLLYDAKAPRGQKSKEFNDLGHNPSNASISLFYIITKYFIFITI